MKEIIFLAGILLLSGCTKTETIIEKSDPESTLEYFDKSIVVDLSTTYTNQTPLFPVIFNDSLFPDLSITVWSASNSDRSHMLSINNLTFSAMIATDGLIPCTGRTYGATRHSYDSPRWQPNCFDRQDTLQRMNEGDTLRMIYPLYCSNGHGENISCDSAFSDTFHFIGRNNRLYYSLIYSQVILLTDSVEIEAVGLGSLGNILYVSPVMARATLRGYCQTNPDSRIVLP